MSIEAMKRALEALWMANTRQWPENKIGAAINALSAAIEQAEKQEPVAWMFDQAKYGPTDLRGQQWRPALSWGKPYTENGTVRGLTPLYAQPLANRLANQIETSSSPVIQFPRHTSVLAEDWTIDPAFLLRVKHTIAPDHPAEFTPSMEEIETTLLALEAIPSNIYATPPAAQRQWVGLTEKDFSAINQSCLTKLQAATSAESILKEKNHG